MQDGWSRGWTRLARRMMVPDRQVRRMLREMTQQLPGALFESLPPVSESAVEAGARLVEVAAFGANPGRLRMRLHVPAATPRPGAPLLVLLHGCGQDAVRFAESAGFVALADRLGAPLLLPDQQAENNHQRCFNWFRPSDIRRGGGEVASIRQMVAEVMRRFASHPGRVFVAGLSAGGALAAALLAAYPDVFAAGAVVAGLPVHAAEDAHGALLQMRHPQPLPRADWAARVPAPPGVCWPRLSIWHGEADRTVDPANGAALAAQWTALLGLPEAPSAVQFPASNLRRRVWRDDAGAELVEHWTLAGFDHAFPVADGRPADPFVLPAGIEAADVMARFWGLDPA